jgi:hypothetical protein
MDCLAGLPAGDRVVNMASQQISAVCIAMRHKGRINDAVKL